MSYWHIWNRALLDHRVRPSELLLLFRRSPNLNDHRSTAVLCNRCAMALCTAVGTVYGTIGSQPYPVIYAVANPLGGHKEVRRSTGYNSQARTETGKYSFFPVELTMRLLQVYVMTCSNTVITYKSGAYLGPVLTMFRKSKSEKIKIKIGL